MNKSIKYLIVLFVITLFSPNFVKSQNLLGGQVSGNFQSDIHILNEDSLIGAPPIPEKLLMNAFANIIYTNGNFTSGIRYESYLNPIQGYDSRYKGSGIQYRFASYKHKDFEITVGNYYEQFGSGLIFRAYEDRNLGYDNAMDGIKLRYSPYKGIYLKGIIGQQRFFFDKGEGIVRGIDGEIALNECFKALEEKKTRLFLGGSFISKYQRDMDPILKLPENVAAYATRLNLIRGGWNFMGEYAMKYNDPSFDNGYIYKNGSALLLNLNYSKKGMAFLMNAKRVDNMSFRSDRGEKENALLINYLPTITRQHTYSLPAMYPYATQLNGEAGFQTQFIYNFPKKSLLGGKYGTKFTVNYSLVYAIDKQQINDSIPIGQKATLGYTSDFFTVGEDKYFEDLSLEVEKKFSSKLKMTASYIYLMYNMRVIEGHEGNNVYANVGLLDMTYKIKPKHAIRGEIQHLSTKQDDGNWALLLAEYTISPHWSFAVLDQYNYGNPEKDKQIHYYMASMSYTKSGSKIMLSYGKQREGIVCIGGVCRQVPAANGLMLTITSSF
jgi:hypothetical protein